MFNIWYYAVGFAYFQRRIGTTSAEYSTTVILTLLVNALVSCFLPAMVRYLGDFKALVLPLQPMYTVFLVAMVLITKDLGGTMGLYALHILTGIYT